MGKQGISENKKDLSILKRRNPAYSMCLAGIGGA
jgi:hypothetical protein